MTILTLNRKELEKKVGKITKEVEEKITMMGTPVEELSSDELSVEVFPNRPDLLNLQNFSLAVSQYLGKGKIAKFKIENTGKIDKDYKIKIEKSVKAVRPHTACAIVKGLKLDDEKIKEIIDIQEKMHNSIGRKRKKIAIGIYPLEKIKLPIRFIAKKPDEIKFLPLESRAEMTGRQILRQHPAGKEYAHLLEDAEVFPIFVDADDNVLSMPPIINSEKTGRITEKTKEIFIECSGFNLHYLKKCLNIVLASLYEMGGKIYAMNIEDEKNFVSPDLDFEKMEFKISDVNKTLGLELSEKEIKTLLEKMGIGFEKVGDKIFALVPPYRMDILHWIDIAEEVALAYGYENFKPEVPSISTVAEEDSNYQKKKVLSEILCGLGLLETCSNHLMNKKDIKKMHFDYKDFLEVENSKTENDVLRIDLLSVLLRIFSENSDSQYPQKIFEIGKVFEKNSLENSETGVKETEHLAIALAGEKINFTELKQIFDYILKMMEIDSSRVKIVNVENSNYIIGRCGEIFIDGKSFGLIGEIAPRVLKNWKIGMPIVGLEINLAWILN